MRYTSVAGAHLIGARLRAWVLGYIPSKPPSHRPAYHCVGWHAVMASDTGWQDEEIVGFLGPISLHPLAVPAYETLSFVWGTLLATCNIVCEGECISITESLDFVLRRLRQTRRSEHSE